ncbi:MAG: DNA mismatch repair protein MutS, partial [Catalinimonas sp.]
FTAPLLRGLQGELLKPTPVPAVIKDLVAVVRWLDARANLLYGLVNWVLMVDLHVLRRLERWQARHLDEVPRWFEALAELDALNALAGIYFAHPDWCRPEVADGTITFEAEGLGHPLLPPDRRVRNDFAFEGAGKILLVTGANMAGKSTFLRTVGVNMVLAQAGAPVCARRFRMSTLQVFTSMRTQDSLEESVSGFYAELRRLRQLLDLLRRTDEPVFYMLDEILKGTNSRDRQTGALALIKQLHRERATGMISTHDVELGQRAADLGVDLTNLSFNSTITGEEIHFDYRLTPGLCRSFNATKLMEQIGIAVEAADESLPAGNNPNP